MKMRRRDFFSTAAIAGAGIVAGNRAAAQDAPARGAGAPKATTYTPKIEMLWKSPDRYPNALESSAEGLWVGDQVSERINLLDWQTGKVLQDFVGEAHNTSGLAVGGGFIWIGCNGAGTASNLREFKRPFDKSYGEIVKLVADTGRVRSEDTITVEREGEGSTVVYDACLTAQGVAKLANPLLAVALRRIGDAAAAGLRAVITSDA